MNHDHLLDRQKLACLLLLPFEGAFYYFSYYFFLSLVIHKTVSADPILVNTYCPNATFALKTSFLSNRDLLLNSLASNANQPNSFYNTSVGSKGSGSNAVYGLFLCRGDEPPDTCSICVATAVNYTNTTCSRAEGALIWYEECMIWYSTESNFYQSMDDAVQVIRANGNNVTGNVTEFVQIVDDMFEEIVSKVSNGSSSKKFATLRANFTNQTLYGLGQCIPDLSASDCYSCLNYSVGVLYSKCSGQRGARVLYPSCIVWYELNLDFLAAPAPALLPPPPPPPLTTITPPSKTGGNKKSRLKVILAIVFPVAIAMALVIAGIKLLRKRKSLHSIEKEDNNGIIATKSLQYDFCTLQVATNHFSEANKLGEGGFGAVYKGTLPNGEEIAVKRLSRRSNQGAAEFKNEVNLVAQLQHKNLVRLLGFCLVGDEKLLVLEFVPNKSLGYFLFNSQRQGQLDWIKRYKIIQDIARGMLYLHEDSRPRIIHRDLKASNILLDMDFNPKIADFGLARIFDVDQTHEETERPAGTFGYMAPEYVTRGQFSVKSDVYSFGVLVLEIVSGKKNTSFHQSDSAQDLLSYSWKNWRDGTALEIMDSTLRDSHHSSAEVLRCIQLGLLCVQKDIAKRPTMTMIVNMLNNSSLSRLPVLQQPPFLIDSYVESRSREQKHLLGPSSVNEASITELSVR